MIKDLILEELKTFLQGKSWDLTQIPESLLIDLVKYIRLREYTITEQDEKYLEKEVEEMEKSMKRFIEVMAKMSLKGSIKYLKLKK